MKKIQIQKGVAALLLLTMPCGLAACGTAAAAQVVPDKVSSTSEVASSSVGQTYVYMEQHDLPPKQVSYGDPPELWRVLYPLLYGPLPWTRIQPGAAL